MPTNSDLPAKPQAEVFRPELTRLPELTPERLRYRAKVARRCRKFIAWFTRASIHGLENLPNSGPAVLIFNHLGDLDIVLGLAALPVHADGIGKVELYDEFPYGRWMDEYGIIWIHRGTADLRAIRAALKGLAEGRFMVIAPEARQSVTGSLENGTGGAAFLALHARVPVIPIAFVGTENRNTHGSWRRLKRPVVSLTVGRPISLDDIPSGPAGVRAATDRIMLRLAAILPESYRGEYAPEVSLSDDSDNA